MRMKLRSSLKFLKSRHSANVVVKRGKKVFIVNKLKPKYKARQR
ncbi:50S ribosomal protein L36 [Candidatus Hodgkinia cicadicola]|nr:50S ribosomal protein L36 [Candidatus Hodgkinia cicadicola]